MNASGLPPVGVGANCGKHRFWFGLKIELPVPTYGGIAVGLGQLCSPAGAWANVWGRANNAMLPKRNMVSSFRIMAFLLIVFKLLRTRWTFTALALICSYNGGLLRGQAPVGNM